MTPDDTPLFPDEAAPRRGRRLVAAAVVIVLAVLAAAVGTSLASGGTATALVTAVAAEQDVAAELHGVATIEPVVQAAVAFPADGTVRSVDVAVGDTVAVGQQLASLDEEDLTKDLHAAEATSAEAELALRRALDGESVDDPTGSAGTSATPTAAGEDTTSEVVWAVATQGAATDEQLTALQRAVLDAQRSVDESLAASTAALSAADEVCAASGGATDAEDATTTTTTTTTTAAGTDLETCRVALEGVQAAQQSTASAQQLLADAAAALDAYLLAQEPSGTGGTIGGSTSGTNAAPTDGTSTASSSPSSAELVALQQQVDAAALGVAVAQQAIAQATIVSPIAGTVVAVGVAAGDDVTAASATQTITVQGDDGMEAVTTVSLADVAGVEVGQAATVRPDGSDEVIDGEVVAVGAVPDDDAASTSYRVTIGFSDDAAQVGNGTIGSVTIVTGEVRSALAVPTSAVTWVDGRATVQVVVDGAVDATTVEVGVIGAEWAEVRSGISVGDEVVLATASDPLPGAATESSSAGTDSRFPGGATAGGDLPAGGPPSGMGGPPGS